MANFNTFAYQLTNQATITVFVLGRVNGLVETGKQETRQKLGLQTLLLRLPRNLGGGELRDGPQAETFGEWPLALTSLLDPCSEA